VWRLAGRLRTTAALSELIEQRLATVEDAARPVLELLALCQPLGIADLEAVAPLDTLERLETLGLIVLSSDERRQQITLAHNLYLEAIRDHLPALRARSILAAQIRRTEAYGARRRADPLRLATWRLDAGLPADPELLVRAARLARTAFDFAGVARLARPAFEENPTFDAGELLGDAYYELGRFSEADEVFVAVEKLELTSHSRSSWPCIAAPTSSGAAAASTMRWRSPSRRGGGDHRRRAAPAPCRRGVGARVLR